MKRFLNFLLAMVLVVQTLPIWTVSEAATSTLLSGTVDYTGGTTTATCTGVVAGVEAIVSLEAVTVGGRNGVKIPAYFMHDGSKYFNNDSGIKVNLKDTTLQEANNKNKSYDITVSYYDEGIGMFFLTYDSYVKDRRAQYTDFVYLKDTKKWKTHTFTLNCPKFLNAAPYGVDFVLRIADPDAQQTWSKGDVVIDKITIKENEDSFPIVLTDYTDENKGNMFFGNDTAPTLKLAYTSKASANLTNIPYTMTITDMRDGSEVKVVEGEVTLNRNGGTISLPTELTEYGAYNADIEFNDWLNGYYGVYSTNFSISVYAEKNDKFGLGMHSGQSGRNSDDSLPLAKAMGTGILRDSITWESAEAVGANGTISVPENFTKWASKADELGMETLLCLTGNHSDYKDVANDAYFPVSDKAQNGFANFVEKTTEVMHAAGTDSFEVWNEFHHNTIARDGTNMHYETAETFMNLQKKAYAKVKKVDTNNTLVGFGGLPSVWHGWVQAMYKKGGAGYDNMDAYSMHEYYAYGTPEKGTLYEYMEILNGYSKDAGCADMPVWITETGFSTGGYSGTANGSQVASTYAQQYQYGIRLYALYQKLGVDKYFHYDMEQDGLNQYDVESCFGLIFNTDEVQKVPLSAKPAYVAYANMNNLLANADYTSGDKDSLGAYNYMFTRPDGKRVWLIWNPDSSSVVSVNVGDANVVKVDAMGNEQAITATNGTYSVTATAEPIYIYEKTVAATPTPTPSATVVPTATPSPTATATTAPTATATARPSATPEPNSGIFVNQIDYATGEIEIGVNGIDTEKCTGIFVTKPGKQVADIYTDTFAALAYIDQPISSNYKFTFKATDEGNYTVWANMGSEVKRLTTAYYKPFGVTVNVKQGNTSITEFSQIKTGTPLSVTANVDNSNASNSTYIFVCATYKEGKLVGAAASDGRLDTSKSSEQIDLSLSVGNSIDFDTVKVFFWKDKTRLLPMIDTIDINNR